MGTLPAVGYITAVSEEKIHVHQLSCKFSLASTCSYRRLGLSSACASSLASYPQLLPTLGSLAARPRYCKRSQGGEKLGRDTASDPKVGRSWG